MWKLVLPFVCSGCPTCAGGHWNWNDFDLVVASDIVAAVVLLVVFGLLSLVRLVTLKTKSCTLGQLRDSSLLRRCHAHELLAVKHVASQLHGSAVVLPERDGHVLHEQTIGNLGVRNTPNKPPRAVSREANEKRLVGLASLSMELYGVEGGNLRRGLKFVALETAEQRQLTSSLQTRAIGAKNRWWGLL